MEAQHQPHARVASPPPAIVEDAIIMKPGRYIELRRLAAGLTLEQAAGRAVPPSGTKLVAELVRQVEADTFILDDAQLDDLRRAFAFDPFIYQCLRDGVPAGQICTKCGCSWNDACRMPNAVGCAWSRSHPDRCTACEVPRRAPLHLVISPQTGDVMPLEQSLAALSAAQHGAASPREDWQIDPEGPWRLDPEAPSPAADLAAIVRGAAALAVDVPTRLQLDDGRALTGVELRDIDGVSTIVLVGALPVECVS